MIDDFRYALRALRAAPPFTIVAVATLGLGIAVNTIAFTLLNSLALRPMPVPNTAGLVRIYPVMPDGRRQNLFSYPDYEAFRDAAAAFEAVVAYIPSQITLGRDGSTEPARDGLAYAISANHFSALGLQPALGRTFTREEESRPAAAQVAIISHAMWQRRYGGAPDVAGKTVTLNGRTFSIVGVGPARFAGTEPLSTDVWVPLGAQPILDGADRLRDRDYTWLLVLGRVKAGVSHPRAASDLSVIASRLSASYPSAVRPAGVAVAAATFFTLDRELQPVLALLMGTVGLVLVIACANVANLSLARGAARRREIAVRLALGASRWRLVRVLLTESILIGLAGGAAGLLMSAWTLRLVYPLGVSLLPESWPAVVLDLNPDVRVFFYTFCLSILAGVTFGLVPALQGSRPGIAAALRDDGTVFGVRLSRAALRDALVVVQIAICLMLLAAAGLTARALQRTRTLDLGFHADGVVYTQADLRRHGYTPGRSAEFYHQLTGQAATLPGVTSVALTSHVPLLGGVTRGGVRTDGGSQSVSTITAISANYFATLGIPVVQGRAFTADEAASGAPVAIVSDALARRFWPAPPSPEGHRQPPALGRQLMLPQAAAPLTIVGVVKDAADVAIWRDRELSVYLPLASAAAMRNVHMLVRANVDPELIAADVRARAEGLDANVRFDARPLNEVLRLWILPSRAAAIGAAVLGALALLMASIGIFGVVAYAVSQRTREIGIRVALGASASDVVRLALGQGLRLIAAGVLIGLIGAFVTTRLLKGVLAGVSPLDPVALAACYVPARRAAAVEPTVALRDN